MEQTVTSEPDLGVVDLKKLSHEELILTVQELIDENGALKDRIRSLEKSLAIYTQESQKQNGNQQNLLPGVAGEDETILSNDFGTSPTANCITKFDEDSDDSKGADKDEGVEEAEEVDTEAYFQKMTAIIRDMAKSPSVILNANEADNVFGKLKKNGNKEKADLKMWEKEILPFLKNKEQREKVKAKIKSVIYSFIPTKYRSQVWPVLIGNPLRIKRSIYDQYCKLLETNPIDSRTSYIIREDLVRTYPNFKCFNKGEALNNELQCLLELFQLARPDIGYVQGMAYPATMLLLHMDRYHAFKCLVNLIVGSNFLRALFTFDLKKMRRSFRAFDYYLKQKNPASYKHLIKMGIQSETFLIEWYYTLYCRSFSIHDCAKIWDVFLLEGEIVFLRVALRIFKAIEPQLLKKDFAQTLNYIRTCTASIDIETIFKHMQYSKMTPERLERFYEKDKKKVPSSDDKSIL